MGLPAAIIHEFLLDIKLAKGERCAGGARLTLSDGPTNHGPGTHYDTLQATRDAVVAGLG